MTLIRSGLTLVVAAACAATAGLALAQTPSLQTTPKLTLQWLSAVSVAPSKTTVSMTAPTELVVTVTLLRAAIAPTQVSFTLTGASLNESNVLAGDGNVMPASLTIPAGAARATTTIYVNKAPPWDTRTFTLTAAYGSERKSTTFTIIKRQ